MTDDKKGTVIIKTIERWKGKRNYLDVEMKCSECGGLIPSSHDKLKWNYCPECGVRFDWEYDVKEEKEEVIISSDEKLVITKYNLFKREK